jgi:hypothetical protein
MMGTSTRDMVHMSVSFMMTKDSPTLTLLDFIWDYLSLFVGLDLVVRYFIWWAINPIICSSQGFSIYILFF